MAVQLLWERKRAWQAILRDPPARLQGKLIGLGMLSGELTMSLKPLAESMKRA